MVTQEDIYAALKRHFGFDDFRDGQYQPIAEVLNGRDAVVVMPTGSGKSLCYQLAALMLPGVTLVVSPLIALMKDQVAALERRGIAATFLNSTVPLAEMDARLAALVRGDYKLVYIAPERFRNERFLQAISRTELALLTIDEAHCISQWGHDFRPDYLTIRDALTGFPDIPILAVTATATPAVREDIVRQLRLGEAPRTAPYVQVQGFGRDNLDLSVVGVRGHAEKFRHVEDFVRRHRTGIVYTATRKHAETVYEGLLERKGRLGESTPLLYHAGLSDAERSRVYEAFVAAKYPVVVATNAFGMGVDRADIRFVVHWDIPGSVEAYYQEVGRAGRDGLPSFCRLLFSYADVRTQEFFIDGANPSWDVAAGILQALRRLPAGQAASFDTDALGKSLGANGIAAETVLALFARLGAVTLTRGRTWRDPPTVVFNPAVSEETLRAAFAERAEKERRDRQRLRDMIHFCDTSGCRHRYILSYFGETARADVCGGCDRCGPRTPPAPLTEEQWLVVQKALSCIGRMKGEHAVARVAEVLLGVSSAYTVGHGLEKLSTWGLLKGTPPERLNILLESLVRAGCARLSAEGEDRVCLTPKGARVARREEADFTIRWPDAAPRRRPAPAPASRPARRSDGFGADLAPDEQVRARALRHWRAETAEEMGIAAFRIMSNQTLFAIARADPRSRAHLSHLVYSSTLNEFGEDILDVLSDCRS